MDEGMACKLDKWRGMKESNKERIRENKKSYQIRKK